MFGIGMMFTVSAVNGQTVDLTTAGSSYVQNFDNANTLADINWTFADVNNDGNTGNNAANGQGRWLVRSTVFTGTAQSSNVARGGTGKCAVYNYDGSNAANDWMFSNGFNLAAGTQYKFVYYRFAPSFQNAPAPESFRVMVTSNNTAAGAAGGVPAAAQLKEYTTASTSYAKDSITFTPTTTGIFYFATFAYSAADLYFIAIDDVSVQNMNIPANDVAVTSVTTTSSGSNCSSFSATSFFSVRVRNTGSANQTAPFNVNFSATRNGVALSAISSQSIPTLASGAEVTLTVNLDMTLGGTYVLTATSALPNDATSVNNVLAASVFNPFVDLSAQGTNYSQPFNSLVAAGWLVNPLPLVAADPGWRIVNTSSTTTVLRVLCRRSLTTASNDWMYSNCIQLKGGQKYRISYQRAAFNTNAALVATPEKLKFYVGTTRTPAGMTTQILPNGVSTLGDENVTNTGVLETITSEFTPTTDGVYYFGWLQTSPALPAGFAAADIAGTLIDNFSILTLPNVDMALKRRVPSIVNLCGGLTANTAVEIKAWNAGTTPVTTFTAKYRVRDAANAVRGANMAGTTYITPATNITFTALPVAVNDTISLNFNVNAIQLPNGGAGLYFVDVYFDSGDGLADNDTLRFSILNPYRDLSVDNSSYNENFNSQFDIAWTTLNQSSATGDTAPTNWGYSTQVGFGAGGTGGFYFTQTGTTLPVNATLFSPCLNLVTGKIYSTNFKYDLSSAGTGKVRMLLVNSNNAAGITSGTLIRDYPSITNTDFVTAPNETFTVPTSGIYYIAFQAYSDANATQPALIIDDFSITNTGPLQPPAAPATLTATAAPLQVDLSWAASTSTGVTAPTSYRVDFSTTSATAGFTSLPVVNAPATTFSHTNLTAGTQYFYRVYSTNSAGTSTLFAAGSATPTILAAPTNLVIATQTVGNALTLNWTASPTATGYDIERAVVTGGTPGAYTSVGTPSNTSFNNTGLVTGTVYAYRVRASKGTPLQYSAYSNVVTSAAVLELDQTAFGKQIVVSPNPTDGNFKVDMRNVKPNRVTFIITDLSGKEVHRSVGENEDSFDFNITNVSKGTYLLYINADKGQSVKKVVIK